MKTISLCILFAGFVLAWHHFNLQSLPSVLPKRQAGLLAYENRTCHPTPFYGDVGIQCEGMPFGWLRQRPTWPYLYAFDSDHPPAKPWKSNYTEQWYYLPTIHDSSDEAAINKIWKAASKAFGQGVSCDADGSEKTQPCTPELAAKQAVARKAKR